ncbi:class I adenylate-forming enzyme family protein [Vampirovibrio sp.]|uniref:class I adenylate-forming enzyme family protein n=1 Tax=Vampirovibrio sp. TaxID=2717857 RepID=UPI003593CE50
MSLLFDRLLQKTDASLLALVEEDHRWTLAELREKAIRLASTLQAKGIQPGDRVSIMFMNQKEYLVSFFAVLYAGAVAVPINITLPSEDIIYVVLHSGSKLMLTTYAFKHCFEGRQLPLLMANQPAEDQAYPRLEDAIEAGNSDFQPVSFGDAHSMRILMYTSGTTGKPKGVMLSETNLISNLEGIHPIFKFTSAERLLIALPMFHAYGLIIGLYAMDAQAPIYLVPTFAPKKILQTLIEGKITILPLVPTMFSMLMQGIQRVGADKLVHLKACISGGASLPEKLLRQIEAGLDLVVLEGYGLTETAPVLAVNRPDAGSIAKSVGPALPNVHLKLVDEQGQPIPWQAGQPSAEGEILAKGPNVMLGYYNLPDETTQVFDPEGYLRTGDLGHFDANGNLFISGGRIKDLIIKAGENIAPIRIEDVLYQHPAVMHAAVIGVPDEKLGEDIVACIELKEEAAATEAELKKFCLAHLPAFMIPAAIRIYPELPKNQTGKVIKKQLRAENQHLLQKANS